MHLLIFTSMFDVTSNIDGPGSEFKSFEPIDVVAGVLFSDRNRCVEVIEGGEGAVRGRYDSVANDPRFSDVKLLVDQPVEQQTLSGRRSDSFLVEVPALVEPDSISCLRTLHDLHFPMTGAGFVLFLEEMIDAVDRFGILRER